MENFVMKNGSRESKVCARPPSLSCRVKLEIQGRRDTNSLVAKDVHLYFYIP